MELTIIRHGETDWNKEIRYQGSSDNELNEVGIRQVEEIAENLADRNFDFIVSSSLMRARKTAEIISNRLKLRLQFDERFRERCVGVYEGLTATEVQLKHPEQWKNNSTRHMFLGPKSGESVFDVAFRIQKGIEELYSKHKDSKILVVTHGFASRIIAGLLSRLSDDAFYQFKLKNCESMTFKIE